MSNCGGRYNIRCKLIFRTIIYLNANRMLKFDYENIFNLKFLSINISLFHMIPKNTPLFHMFHKIYK
jgi:hypothetical protein